MRNDDDDYDGMLRADPEAEWPGELPEWVEEWNAWWEWNTRSRKWDRWYTAYGGRYPIPIGPNPFTNELPKAA